jgi:hypothetical protein
MKYRGKGVGLEKRIDYTPLPIEQKHIYPHDKDSTMKQLDDEKFVVDQSEINYIFVGIGLFGFIGFFFTANEPDIVIRILGWIMQYGLLFMALYGFRNYKKVFIFNRKEGTLTYPETLWFRSKTIPFGDACFIRCRLGPYGGERFHLAIVHADGLFKSIISWDKPEKYFSLFVWYMDKNRPLPPGSAFDPYRQQDYERRKAAEFPKPLYEARIPTPDIDDNPDRYKSDKNVNAQPNKKKVKRKKKGN